MANQQRLRHQQHQFNHLAWFASIVASLDIRPASVERKEHRSALATSVEMKAIWPEIVPRLLRAYATTVASLDTWQESALRHPRLRRAVLRELATTVENQAIWLVTVRRLLKAPATHLATHLATHHLPRAHAITAGSQDIWRETARRSQQLLRLLGLETPATSVASLVIGPETAVHQLLKEQREAAREHVTSVGRSDTFPETVLRHKEEVIR